MGDPLARQKSRLRDIPAPVMNQRMTEPQDELFEQAVEQHRRNALSEAESLYARVLVIEPDNIDAEYLLGTALLQLGRIEEAIERLKNVVAKRPDVADAHNNLGVGYKAAGDWENAARSFQAALKIEPEYMQALFNLGAVMEQRGLLADAEKCYRRSIEIAPDDPEVRWAFANTLKSQSKWEAAEEAYRAIPTGGDRELERRIQLAFVLVAQEKLADGEALYREILQSQPAFPEIHNSLSFIHERRGQLQSAEDAAREAIRQRPDYAEGYNNLGIALRSQHRTPESLAAFERAVELEPSFPLADFNLGATRLLIGEYAAGWPGYEKRVEALGLSLREFDQPRWTGEEIRGRRLLVFSDQGFGDAIQFSRFLSATKRLSGASILFECQPQLIPLLSKTSTIDEFIPDGEQLPEFDYWIPLGSLPGILGITLENLADHQPQQPAEFSLRQELAEQLAEFTHGSGDARLRVGLVWYGNPEQARDAMRSCPLERLRPLLDRKDTDFISLQVGEGTQSEVDELPPEIRPFHLGDALNDFADTAAVMQRLDLIITVDTAAAHLAGTLGKQTRTLLCHTPDWRWGLSGATTAWYPSMRLFRQSNWGEWDGVVKTLAESLVS